MPQSSDASGASWKGCSWVQTDGYGARIQTTTIAVEMVRKKNCPEATEFQLRVRRGEAVQGPVANVDFARTGDSRLRT
jgi:hypothetical protein